MMAMVNNSVILHPEKTEECCFFYPASLPIQQHEAVTIQVTYRDCSWHYHSSLTETVTFTRSRCGNSQDGHTVNPPIYFHHWWKESSLLDGKYRWLWYYWKLNIPVRWASSSLHRWWCSWNSPPADHRQPCSATGCTSIHHPDTHSYQSCHTTRIFSLN